MFLPHIKAQKQKIMIKLENAWLLKGKKNKNICACGTNNLIKLQKISIFNAFLQLQLLKLSFIFKLHT